MGVCGHGRGRHGTELMRVVVRVHGGQIGATVHPAKVGTGRSRVALAVAGGLVVGHGVGGAGRARDGTLHAGGV